MCSAGDLLQPYAVKVDVGVTTLAGQSRLKTAEQDGVSLEGNEEILLGVDAGDSDGEETVAGIGKFVGGAVGEVGGIGDGDEGAGGQKIFVRELMQRKARPPRKAAATNSEAGLKP